MEYAPSLIGYASSALNDPSNSGKSPSFIGYISGVIKRPHNPVGIKVASGIKYVAIKVWDGSSWR